MALIKSTAIPSGATDYELDQSLRFNDDDSAYLSWTPSSAGNRRTWTWSGWVKVGNLGTQRSFLSTTGSTYTDLRVSSENKLVFYIDDGSSYSLYTTQLFRDPSAWYNIVLIFDTTQATASNRVKIYVNGEQITSFSTSNYPVQNYDGTINNNIVHSIGRREQGGGHPYDGYLAEVNFIDGQALTPSSFGETGDYGEWKPRKYSGSYGTNGFYLPFKQDYTVEGFSATLYKATGGNADAPLQVGGVGFQPDLVWTKCRTDAIPVVVFDAVRGENKQLDMAVTDAEVSRSATAYEFETDGFSVSTVGNGNNTGQNYVAWSWDMGLPSPKQITANGNAKISTTQEKFGSSSAYFDGTGDYLSIPQSYDFDLASTTNFTVECWVYHTDTIGGDRVYVSQTEGTYANSWYLRAVGGGEVNLTAWIGGVNFLSVRTGAGVVTQNNWHHVALVKTGTNYKIFIDGTDETDSGGTDSDTATFHSGELRIGDNGSGQYMTGYIDEIRISDTARYSSNFTPSASAFTRDSNTKLLMHNEGANNSTEFLDHSGMDVNTDGSITSNVKANTTYGQSIVSYTGTGSAATVGHGLSSAPDLIIVKNRDYIQDWAVYDSVNGSGYFLRLNATNARQATTTAWNNDATSSVFGVGSWTATNKSGDDHIAYCFHSVTGYSKIGSYTGNGSANHAITGLGFEPAFLLIKRTNSAHDWVITDNTRNPNEPLSLLANTTAAESNQDGDDVSSFDADGFTVGVNARVNGNGDTFIYMAFADNREYAYWLDQSGNNNDWTSNNLTESDISVDSPTNNFCTWNPLSSNAIPTLSEGNLKNGGANNKAANGTFGVSSGKWYWEVNVINTGDTAPYIGVTKFSQENDPDVSPTLAATSGRSVYRFRATPLYKNFTATAYANDSAHGLPNSGILAMALDLDNGTLKYYFENTLYHTDSTIPTDGTTIYPLISGTYAGSTGWNKSIANFGQDSSFASNKTAQGKQDSNDIGDFYYTPPTGFLALCTKNLPDVDVVPSEHFNTVLWTGNATDNRSISGVGFQPDWVWWKERSSTSGHYVSDAVRGATKQLIPNGSNAELSNTDELQVFESDGFQIGTEASINQNSETYVAWNWKAGGSAPSKTYAVTVVSDSGNKYRFDGFGTSAVTLDLQEGGTYTFDQSHSSNSGHPFRFGTSANGSDYTTGVTTSGTPGNSGAYTRITVAAGAPTLYYACSAHSGMGGQANTNSTSGSSNFSGTIQSNNSANVDAGFSIVSWTGNDQTGTIGHGLSKAPELILLKGRNIVKNWVVYHASNTSAPETDFLTLNTTAATEDFDMWQDTAPTATVFSVSANDQVNNSSSTTYIGYCFHSVDGYSKVGSYTGNANTDGTFIYTGFRPAFVITKLTSTTSAWNINDNKRDAENPVNLTFKANESDAENSTMFACDFLSNGFKMRDSGNNNSTQSGIYIAFAETPFKYSNAR